MRISACTCIYIYIYAPGLTPPGGGAGTPLPLGSPPPPPVVVGGGPLVGVILLVFAWVLAEIQGFCLFSHDSGVFFEAGGLFLFVFSQNLKIINDCTQYFGASPP